MTQPQGRQQQLEVALAQLALPEHITIRAWQLSDFEAVQQLALAEGCTTYTLRPEESILAWQNSWPALVATHDTTVVAFLRAITDSEITTYIADLLTAPAYRGRGIALALLDTCHFLYPHTRFDLLSSEDAVSFYKKHAFRFIGEGLRRSYR